MLSGVLEVVRVKEKWLNLTDGAFANQLVHPVFLDVLLNIEDWDLSGYRLLNLHDLRPEQRCLVLLSVVAVVVNAIIIGALGVVIVPATAFLKEAAQLGLQVLHSVVFRGLLVKSTI